MHERVASAVVPSILYESATILAVNKPGGCRHVYDDADASSNLKQQSRPTNWTSGRPACSSSPRNVGNGAAQGARAQAVRAFVGDYEQALQVNGADGEGLSHLAQPAFDSGTVVRSGEKRGGKATHHSAPRRCSTAQASSSALHSGRRHQIRAHQASIGHPIANYAPYGGEPPPVDTHRIYRDDESTGALAQMLEDASVSWCDKCAWCLAAVRGEAEAPFAPSPIWLLSQLCEFPGGPLVAAPLPEWAQAAANVRWTC